jgi:hypothetical protein
MTPAEIRNEHRKLAASAINSLATAIITGGTFAPLVQYLFEVLPASTSPWLIYGSGAISIGAGFLMHLTANLFMRDLE